MKEGAAVTYAMVRATRLSLDEFAAVTGMHPDLIRRLVALGVVQIAWASLTTIAIVALGLATGGTRARSCS